MFFLFIINYYYYIIIINYLLFIINTVKGVFPVYFPVINLYATSRKNFNLFYVYSPFIRDELVFKRNLVTLFLSVHDSLIVIEIYYIETYRND